MNYQRIVRRSTRHHRGKVYDLTVDDVHSYNIDGLAVHNSGAGSLVNYLIGITNVDPFLYGLIFERFLNPDRGHLPDIDSDFAPSKSSMVFDHINDRYGAEHCCNVGTMNYMQARVVVKNVARVYDVELSEVNAITKQIDDKTTDFKTVLENDNVAAFFKKYPGMFEHCLKLFGNPSHPGQHPAGIFITPFPVTDIIPVKDAKETISESVHALSQWPANAVEKAGAVKLDILKITSIDLLVNQLKALKESYGIDLDYNQIPVDDAKTWDVLCDCDTLGIFQMESPIGKNVIAKVQPRNINELSAVNAFIRPGASGLDDFVAAKKDPSKLRRIHPRIDAILADDHGAVVYQESIMSLISELLGISFGKADLYRRALEKPKKGNNAKLVEEFKELAITSGVARGFPKEVCETVRSMIIDNSGYGFNKSHAVAYAIIAYWSMWIKANYPPAFYSALVTHRSAEAPDKLPEVFAEARKHGVTVLGPSITRSGIETTIEDIRHGKLRAGLSVVKGLGEKVIAEILNVRGDQPFTSLNDFVERFGISKTVLMAGVNAGIFEDLPMELTEADVTALRLNLDGFATTPTATGVRVDLVREQQRTLFTELVSLKNRRHKTYKFPAAELTGEALANIDGEVVTEKDGTVVIRDDQLALINVAVDDPRLEVTKCKLKGRLAELAGTKVSPLIIAFAGVAEQMRDVKADPVQRYMTELTDYDVAFTDHPMEPAVRWLTIVNDVADGKRCDVFGIVSKVDDRKTKKGNAFKTVTLLTPREAVKINVWSNNFERQKILLQLGNLVRVVGKKSFGGVEVNSFHMVDVNQMPR